ncbi:MAG: glycosyltransferase [Polyangiaceae bacterium]|jgi:glycosyltransferase involved in cell wall biosynthesis|nr:glycosyltransferase [Polyangiaceae bacterium]
MKLACVPVCNYFTADSRVKRTCLFLMKHGFEVHVLAIGRTDLPEHEVIDGIHVHRYRSGAKQPIRRGVNLTALRAFDAYVRGCVQWVRKHRPSVVHYNDWNTLFLGPLSRVPHRSIYDMHELFQDLDYLNFPKAINRVIAGVDLQGLRRAEAVICVSEPIAAELRALTEKPVYVVRNVPEPRFSVGPGRADITARLRDGRRHLVYLGALQKEKGALDMLQVLSRLPAEYALDCFSGVTPKNAFFREVAESMGLTNRVQVWETLPLDELYASIRHGFAGLSFFVPSSRIYEYALPNKIFEYFLAGLPVVVSEARAQAELVAETGLGLVVELRDPERAAEKILSWAPPTVSRELVERFGLTWEQEEAALERVYRDLGIIPAS